MYDAQQLGTVAAWTGSVGTIAGLIGVAAQVNRSRRVSYGEFVHELDKDYRRYFILPVNGELADVSPVELMERITFFEKVKVLLDQKVIRMSTVDIMFSERFFILAHSEATHRLLNEHQQYLSTFFALHAQWLAHRKKKQEDIPFADLNLATSPLFSGGRYQSLVARGNKLGR